MAVFADFGKKSAKNTFEKVPFLLVRFLWANKENEQDNLVKAKGSEIEPIVKTVFKASNETYSSIPILLSHKRLGHHCSKTFNKSQ